MMPRKLNISGSEQWDHILDTYLGLVKVGDASEIREEIPVLDPLKRLQGEAVCLATEALVKESKERGIVSGVDLELDRVLYLDTEKRGFKVKRDFLKDAGLRYSFSSSLTEGRGLDPLHITVSIHNGEVDVPDEFDEGFRFDSEGLAKYCQEQEGMLPQAQFVYSPWGQGRMFALGSYSNPLDVSRELKKRGFQVSATCRGSEFQYEVVGRMDCLDQARDICKLSGASLDEGEDSDSSSDDKGKLSVGQSVLVEPSYRVVGGRAWRNMVNHKIASMEAASVCGFCKRSVVVTWGDREFDVRSLRDRADFEDLYLIDGILAVDIDSDQLRDPEIVKTAEVDPQGLDAHVPMEEDRQILQERASVRDWLENGGGSWEEMVEEFSARFEDPTYAPMKLKTIVWSLAHGGDEVWALDNEGEPYRVRHGCDVTGSDEIWIERDAVVEHTATPLESRAQNIPAVSPETVRERVAQAVQDYIERNPNIQVDESKLDDLYNEMVRAVRAGQPLSDDYVRIEVSSIRTMRR